MSQENVEIVQAALGAFNRRDGRGLDALLAADAEIVGKIERFQTFRDRAAALKAVGLEE